MITVFACGTFNASGCGESVWVFLYTFLIPTLLAIGVGIGVISVLSSAITLITSAGDTKATEDAWEKFKGSMIGLVIVILAYTIITVIASSIGGVINPDISGGLRSYLFLNVNAADCSRVQNPSTIGAQNPKDLIICGSPTELNIHDSGRSLYDIIMLINNTLAILAVFFSIIGVIVGIINLAKAQSDKAAYTEAKGTITNSLLAFLLVAALWLIVRLVFNTLGIGSLAPTISSS